MNLMERDLEEPPALTGLHTVLLVDDDPAVLNALRRVLRNEPYEVRATSSPRAALEWIRKDRVSLVVLDQRMPELSGTELAERVRRMSPRTVRVLLTAYPGNAQIRHGLGEDVQWLIGKPWNGDALKLTLRRLLRAVEAAAPPRVDGPWGLASGLLRKTLYRFSGPLAKATGWTLGFLWMAEAGGRRS